MKNLKDIILEKLKVTKHDTPELDIDDVDTVIDYLTSDDTARRQIAIDAIREEVINYGCKRMTVTNKIKSSGSYFIQFSKIRIDSETPDSLCMIRQYKYDEYYTIIQAPFRVSMLHLIGKVFFLTREEAEKKLEELK